MESRSLKLVGCASIRFQVDMNIVEDKTWKLHQVAQKYTCSHRSHIQTLRLHQKHVLVLGTVVEHAEDANP